MIKSPPQGLDTFGKRLFYWRNERGFKHQGKFAQKLGISQPSLSELENKPNGEPSASTLLIAAKLLGLEPRYLLFGESPVERIPFNDLNPLERLLVVMYRALDEEKKAEVDLVLNEAYNRQHPEKSPANPFPAAGQPPIPFAPAARRVRLPAAKKGGRA